MLKPAEAKIQNTPCPVCATLGVVRVRARGGVRLTCIRCGTFILTRDAIDIVAAKVAAEPESRLRMSDKLRALQWHKKTPLIDAEKAVRLTRHVPGRYTEKARRNWILYWLEKSGDWSAIEQVDGWAAIAKSPNAEDALRLIRILQKDGLISSEKTLQGRKLTVTDKGREYVEGLREKSRRGLDDVNSDVEGQDGYISHLYISKLYVENFRSFKDAQYLDLLDDEGEKTFWTTILGENGVGKSTLLQLMAGLFPVASRYAKGRPRQFETNFEARDLSYFLGQTSESPAQKSAIEITVEFEDADGWTRRAAFGAMKGASLDGFFDVFHVEFDTITLQYGGDEGYSFYMGGWDSLGGLPLLVGYGATRGPTSSTPPSDLASLSSIESLFGLNSHFRDPEDWLLKADYAAKFESQEIPGLRHRFEKMKGILVSVLPDVTDVFVVPPTPEVREPKLRFDTPYGKVQYSDLSVGYQTVVSMVVDLAIRLFEYYPDDVDPLSCPAIVLIDEIDLHLHPSWQRQIASELGRIFPKVQFIATTHAPLVVQGSEVANLAVVVREDDAAIIRNNVDEIRAWRVDQILTSELFEINHLQPAFVDNLERERVELIRQDDRTPNQIERLRQIDLTLSKLPIGGSLADKRAIELLRSIAERADGRAQ